MNKGLNSILKRRNPWRKRRLENTYISSSGSFFSAFLAIHWKASSTLKPSFAEVSKYGMFPLEAHQAFAFFSETYSQKSKTTSTHYKKRTAAHTSYNNIEPPYSRWHTTRLFPPSTSILFPNTTNGKFSGSDGLA